MAKEIRVEVCESLDVCQGRLDNGDTVVIPAGSLWALPVYEDDGSGDVLYGQASDLRTLAKAWPGQFIKRGPTLMTFGTHSRPLACEKCGAADGAHVRGFAGEDVVRLVRDSIAYKHLQERHSRLHDEKGRQSSRDFAEIQKLREEREKLREEIDRINHQLKNVSEEREKLAGQVESSKVGNPALNSLREEIKRQQAEILMLREQVESLKNLKVEVTGSEFVTIRGATSGETELASLRAEIDRQQAELASLRLRGRPLFSHRQKIAVLEKRVKELEASEAEEIKRLRDLFHDVSSRSPFYSDESPVALVDLAKKQGETHAAIIVKGEISSEAKIEFTAEHANVGIAAGKVFARLIRDNWALRNRVEQKTKENAVLTCTKAACVKTLEDRHTEALRENERLAKQAKESEAVAQGLADDVQKLNKKITELASARSGDDVKIVSIDPLESPLGDVVKPRGVLCPKASDFYVTTREPVFKPGALVGDSSVTEVCNLVTQEKIELNSIGLEVVYSGKFCYSEIPPSKQVASVIAFSPAFVAELMAKADRYDKVEAIVAPMVEVPTQDLKGLSNEGSGIGKSII